MTTDTDTGTLLATLSDWIDNAPDNAARDREAALWGRVAKISEEHGEVIAAMIGMTGQNPRKGITHTREDVIGELLDVAVTALDDPVAADEVGVDVVVRVRRPRRVRRAGAVPVRPVRADAVPLRLPLDRGSGRYRPARGIVGTPNTRRRSWLTRCPATKRSSTRTPFGCARPTASPTAPRC